MADDDWQDVRRIAAVLEIAAPGDATAAERRQWVTWWAPSYETARVLSDADKAYLKQGGWWPPATAAQIRNCRPNLETGYRPLEIIGIENEQRHRQRSSDRDFVVPDREQCR
ncbi:MAG: hypothetical protein P4L10_14340 [Acidobacteriaceae bacterium]|nr:hypothetical protein [Acidobacteriaceae bacterium]